MEGHHPAVEQYLETILELEEAGIVPMRARIVERLGVSAPAVSETVKRLEREGYVSLDQDRVLHLSEAGRAYATSMLRRHRLAEVLLVDVLKVPWPQVHEEACRLEHAISDNLERHIVELLGELKSDTGITTLLISHDISVIRRLSDRVAVMYAGTVVESGPASRVLQPNAGHPYTAALLASVPDAETIRAKSPLQAIEGEVPDMVNLPRGCRFYGRCNRVTDAVRDRCAHAQPPLAEIGPGHKTRCWLKAA